MSCANTFNVCVVSGTDWALDVGLTMSFVEVAENPGDFQFEMNFLDGPNVLLTLTSSVEVDLDDPLGAFIRGRFIASPAQTATLPEGRFTHTVDLAGAASLVRLFEGKAQVRT